MKVPLSRIAHTRSGDKGDTCNIGVIAYDPQHYPLLLKQVTAKRVKTHFGELVKVEVERFNSRTSARSISCCTRRSEAAGLCRYARTPKVKPSAPLYCDGNRPVGGTIIGPSARAPRAVYCCSGFPS